MCGGRTPPRAVNILRGWPPAHIVSPSKSSMPARNSQTESERGFDAVAESRKWKEAVAHETAGMSVAQRMAYFRRHSSVLAIRNRASSEESAESCVVREEPPNE